MKRILYISNYRENLGGISQQVKLLNTLVGLEQNFKTSIFSTKDNFFNRILLFFKLIVVGKDYDIFHIHGCSYWGFIPVVYGVLAGKLLRKKIIITYHGGEADRFLSKHPFITRYFLRNSDHLIVMSDYLQEVFIRHGYNVKVIPNIIHLDKTFYIQRKIINPKFISIRSLEPLYNIRLILEAFNFIIKDFPEASLIILGDGTRKKELTDYARQLQLKNIQFKGYVSNETIFEYLADSDIMINSPVIDNMPISLLEAFLSGVLVISSRVGGVPYMIEHGSNGLLFESGNLEDLVDKIKYALVNQDLSKKMILNAYNSMEKYNWRSVKKNILELYN